MTAGTVTAYQWRAGARLRGSAQVAGEAIERIAKKHGGVCPPRALVEEAKRPRHPCHAMFEWDDESAADEWRVEQARRIIRSIRVVRGKGQRPRQAYVHVKSEGAEHEGYMDADRAMAAPDLRALVLQEAVDALHALQERYDHLEELAAVWEAVP
jgi:hypothetical protein